jgi:hypothetical protein
MVLESDIRKYFTESDNSFKFLMFGLFYEILRNVKRSKPGIKITSSVIHLNDWTVKVCGREEM